jgi:acyl-CoA dehydrogenase
MPVVTARSTDRPIFTEDHTAFRDSVRRFVATEVAPGLAGWQKTGTTPRTVVAAAGAAGFLGITAGEEFGGAGIDDRGFLTVLIEQTVECGAFGLALLWALHSGISIPAIGAHSSDEARKRWLPGLVSGEIIGVPVRLDGSSLESDAVTGVLENVPYGGVADLLIGTLPDGGIVLIPTADAGVGITRVESNLTTRDADFADIVLDRVPVDSPSYDTDLRAALHLWFSVLSLASARYALGLAVDYSRERTVFGRPLAEFENTRLRLAHLTAALSATTSFVDDCVGAGATLTAVAASVACVTAADVHDRCVDQSLQLHGGYGYMREYPVSAAFADARFLRLLTQQYTNIERTLADELGL